MAENADLEQVSASHVLTCLLQESGAESLQAPSNSGCFSRIQAWCWSQPPLLTEMLQLLLLALTYTGLCYALTKIISFLKHKNFSAKIAAFIPKAGCPDTRLSQVGAVPVQTAVEEDSSQKRK